MKYQVKNKDYKTRNFYDEVLLNRQITQEDIDRLLNVSYEYKDPFAITGMRETVDFFNEVYDKELIIGLLVDSDADGYTSSSILYRFLTEEIEHPIENIRIFLQEGKQHGLNSKVFKEMLESDVNLWIIADSSSNDTDRQEQLHEKGMNIIILDHHNVDKEIPECVYLVNNQFENSASENLSGVGVVGKFIEALGFSVEKYLDVIAIGNIADSMDLMDLELRGIINHGLSHIESDLVKQFLNGIKEPCSTDVSFNIANYMNSVIRFGKKDEKQLLWDCLIGKEGTVEYKKKDGTIVQQSLTEAMERIANNVKNRQRNAVKKAVEELKKDIKRLNLEKDKCIILRADKVESSIRGLVAQKIVSEYKKSCILLSKFKDNELAGSVRATVDIKELFEKSGLVNFAQGHMRALGVGLVEENVELLREYLNKAITEDVTESDVYDVDYVFEASCVKLEQVKQIGNLRALWNKNCLEPLFVLKGIEVSNLDIQHKRVAKGYETTFKYNGATFKKRFSSLKTYEQMICKDDVKVGRKWNLEIVAVCKFVKDERTGFYYIQIEDFNSKVNKNIKKKNDIIF